MQPILAVFLAFGTYPVVVIGLRFVHRLIHMSPEAERKLMHIAAGVCLLPLPWLLHSIWAAALLFSAFIFGPFYANRFVWSGRVFGRTLKVARKSLGGPMYGLGFFILFILARNTPLYYFISAAVLVFADALAAIVGIRWPLFPYRFLGSKKTFSGSLTFFTIAFLIIFSTLLFTSSNLVLPVLVVSIIIAALTTFVEAASPFGLDNLFIPLFVFAMLHSFHRGLYMLANNLLFGSFS